MTALRQEALQIVNDIPENLLSELVKNLREFKSKLTENFSGKKSEVDPIRAASIKALKDWRDSHKDFFETEPELDPKKAAAYAAIAEWRERNRKYLTGYTTDWEKERELAMEEKYGRID